MPGTSACLCYTLRGDGPKEKTAAMRTTAVAPGDEAVGSGTEERRRFGELLESLSANVSRTVVASEESVRSVLLALVTRGHLLLEDAPGVGKTLMA